MNKTQDQLAVSMYEKGLRVESIAELLGCAPSTVANALIGAGHTPCYPDIYTSGSGTNYARMLAGVLRFKDADAAKQSVRRLSELYEDFERMGDRRGMHHCMSLALTGFNRAMQIGKWREANMFATWIQCAMVTQQEEARRAEST